MGRKKNKLSSILFATQGSINTASTRFRVLSFIDKFNKNGVTTKILQLPSAKQPFKRILFILNLILNAPKYQIVFIQKVLLPKWILYLIHTLNKHIVYDWDDAIFSSPPSDILTKRNTKSKKRKLEYILSNCELAICGNRYLEKYAKQFNQNTAVIPTSVDEKRQTQVKNYNADSINIGWIGRAENLIYLRELQDMFIRLEKQYGEKVRFRIVCDNPLVLDGVNNIDNIKWRLENELSDIRSFDIGIMPLSNDEWTQGKCAFKLLQYMAAGVPCVGSAVGANSEVISHNHNGILVSNTEDWYQSLEELINQPEKRKTLAQNAIENIKNNYSIDVIFRRLLSILEQLH